MNLFDQSTATRIVSGPGKISALGELARDLEIERVLVVSDPGIVAAGHTQHGLDSLNQAKRTTRLFDGVSENPTTEHVAAGLKVAQEFRPELIVGLGGGSSMDCAKGINFLVSCGGKMQDYWGIGKATGPMLPMIAVPTTAGTGSETQSFALICDAQTHQKMACGDRRAAFRVAILDPELTLTQPPLVAALTGFDALSHAVETSVTKSRTPQSLQYSHAAWQHLAPSFLQVLQEPKDLEARSQMQQGACLAGLAIEHSMLGAAHALANPLTAAYGITHGQAVALMLPHVVRFNSPQMEQEYRELLATTAIDSKLPRDGDSLADFLATVAHEAGLAGKLRECNVRQDNLAQLAKTAAEQWTGTFNPVPLSTDDFLQLYELAY